MHFWCSKYTNRDAFATRGQNRNLKFHHKPFQKLPLLFFCLFSILPYRTFFISKIENKSLTSVVGLERPLIISNWLCACTSINWLVPREVACVYMWESGGTVLKRLSLWSVLLGVSSVVDPKWFFFRICIWTCIRIWILLFSWFQIPHEFFSNILVINISFPGNKKKECRFLN